MTTILVLFAALVGGGQPCAEAISLESCDALLSEGVPPIQDLGHIAVVKPPWERKAEASAPAESMPASEPEATPDPQPEPTASIEPAPEAVATVAAPEEPSTPSAWVVQVAAFEDQAKAQEGVRRIGREDIVVMPTRRDGQDWYVLLISSYSSFEEADTAGREYAEATGQSFWVRDASGLKAMEVREDYGS